MTDTTRSGRTGLILAAGYGSRHALGDETILKPLLAVGGRPLILRAIDSLQRARCTRVVIVLGHEAERIRGFVTETYEGDVEIEFVVNAHFDLQNGVSVLAARDLLPPEYVLSMADHVFEPSIMTLVADHAWSPNGAALVVDSKLDTIVDMDDATKVSVSNGLVHRIGKDLRRFNAVDCGLFLAGPALMGALDEVFRTRGDASLSEGVQKLAAEGRMEAIDLGPRLWQDVDDADMMSAAERLLSEGR